MSSWVLCGLGIAVGWERRREKEVGLNASRILTLCLYNQISFVATLIGLHESNGSCRFPTMGHFQINGTGSTRSSCAPLIAGTSYKKSFVVTLATCPAFYIQ